jgi:subtilisin family serine protease
MILLLLFTLISAIFGFVEVTNREYPHIRGVYIITYHRNTTEEDAFAHWGLMAATAGVEIRYKYNAGVHKGFSAKLSDDAVAQLQNDPIVFAIEVNGIVEAYQPAPTCTGTTPTALSWGLARLSHFGKVPGNGLGGHYTFDSAVYNGRGVTIYIIDTGILTTHTDFGTRATWADQVFAPGGPVDGNGHGTHCAGTAAGAQYGIATEANLVAVKVLDAGGSGTWEGVIAGVDWVATNGQPFKALGSMSLGGGGPQLGLNAAIQNCLDNNIPIVVAAGNNNGDACRFSPAGAPGVISVGSMEISGFTPNEFDAKSSFSNWGTCMHIWAPGRDITSAWIGASNIETNTISGTSMACPHVAGVVATYLSAGDNFTPDDIKKFVIEMDSQKDILSGNIGVGSPNNLLYNRCGAPGRL